MIEKTFLHLPKVRERTETRLWESGINTWSDFLDAKRLRGFSSSKKASCDIVLKDSQVALAKGDSAFFTRLPSTSHWRLWNEFKDEALFIDIETSWHGDITVLGIYDGKEVKQFVKGENLTKQAVKEHMQGKLFVTYNGASFDLPIIKRYFGQLWNPVPHFDTMHLARRLGYRGGLKILEEQIGVRRPQEVKNMSGHDALHLWELYRASGEKEYLDKLLLYNEEDIVNLARVANHLVKQATNK